MQCMTRRDRALYAIRGITTTVEYNRLCRRTTVDYHDSPRLVEPLDRL
jgi:hypothetical protein